MGDEATGRMKRCWQFSKGNKFLGAKFIINAESEDAEEAGEVYCREGWWNIYDTDSESKHEEESDQIIIGGPWKDAEENCLRGYMQYWNAITKKGVNSVCPICALKIGLIEKVEEQ